MKLFKCLAMLMVLLLVPQALAVTVTVTPETPNINNDLTCSVAGSSNVFNFYWYRENQLELSETVSSSSTLPASETSAGETWTCKVYRPSTAFSPEQYIGEDSVVISSSLIAIPHLIPYPFAVPHLIPACNDGLDNDGDHFVDLNDPGCSSTSDTDESNRPIPPQCSDNIDNDRDGTIDMNDFGCTSPSDDDEEFPQPFGACSDLRDNDGDGLVDRNDPGCSSPTDTDESNNRPVPPQCSDNIDNDRDGAVDMADFGCTSPSDDGEEFPQPLSDCSDFMDNDNDGLVDMNDPGCSSAADDDENNPVISFQCSDHIDNDGDGLVDWLNDPGCSSPLDNDESNPAIPQCMDHVDNDGDGLIDFGNDPGCSSMFDNDETNPVIPTSTQCSDHVDNDGDGLVDLFDPGCMDANDPDETDPTYPAASQCDDGLDNDADGLVDMNDPGCSSTTDNDETDVPTVPSSGGSTVSNGRPKIMDVSIVENDGKLEVRTTIENVGRGRINSGVLTVFIDDLDLMSITGFDDLSSNEHVTLLNVLDLPENLDLADHVISVRVHANGKEDVVYRVVSLGEETEENQHFNVLVFFGDNKEAEPAQKVGFFMRILNWFLSLFRSIFSSF